MKSEFTMRQIVLRVAFAALALLCGLMAFRASASAAAGAGHTGQALTLRAALHPNAARWPDAAVGRFRYPHSLLAPHAGRLLAHAGAAATNPNNVNNQPVQTFDAFAPPSSNFQPPTGVLTGDSHNPQWSADGSFIVFSSSRAGDGHDHLFYVSSNGGSPVQITTGNGDEEFPALNGSNGELAFTSTNNAAGVANLYTINFTPTAGQALVDVATLTSLTLRSDLVTGFSEVRHPTWSPGGDRLVFAAFSNSASDPNTGHFHLYFLFTDSNGYLDQSGQTANNPPVKLTDGPADDTDPAWSNDGRYIAFATTADTLTNNAVSATVTPTNTPTQTHNPTTGARSLFLLSGGNPQPDPFGSTVVTGTDTGGNPILGRVTIKGTDDFGPSWSYPDSTSEPYLNPNGDLAYLAFARAAAPNQPHDVFFLRTEQYGASGTGTISEEGTTFNYSYATGTQPFPNNAVHVNTDDNLNAASGTANVYDDTYPTLAPFGSLFQVAYSSNRTVTYNDVTTGLPVETAQSVPAPTAGGVVNSPIREILISELLNLNPPILLRFSGSEVLHTNAGATAIIPSVANPTGSATKNVQPTQAITITARLSNREAGIDDTDDPTTGGPEVYLQIKDPDSSTQDVQGREHKVFTTDFQGMQNRIAVQGSQGNDSGSATLFLYNLNDDFPVILGPATGGFQSVGEGTVYNTVNKVAEPVRGAVSGRDGDNYLTIGYVTPSFDPVTLQFTPSTQPPTGPTNPPPAAAIDASYNPLGQEYEAQYVNPQFALGGTGDTASTDYGTPFYLAGFDDEGAFTGFRPDLNNPPGTGADVTSKPPRPTAPGVDSITGNPTPAEWLQMTRLPANKQDGLGGVLYSVTWVTPRSNSDFYLDVVAYDKAVFPSIVPPSATPFGGGGASVFVNQNGVAKSNFRIYDNVGGFTTAPFDGSHDILVVSDNALGQKFGFNIFDNQTGQSNLRPTLYGAESYYTDVDPTLIPNCVYMVSSRKDPMSGKTVTSVDLQGFSLEAPQTGLGIGSYSSGPEQRYSLWRILSRGAVPESVMRAYSPTLASQPAVNDPITGFKSGPADGAIDPATGNLMAGHSAKVTVATRCIVWAAPYVGDVFTDAGSLVDTTTQDELRAYVQGGGTLPGGGRLFISGADVAEALTLAGNANNGPGSFLNDILNAKFVSGGGGNYKPTVTASTGHRILYDAYFNGAPGQGVQNFASFNTTSGYEAPGNSKTFVLGNSALFIPGNPGRNADFRTDSSLDQFTGYLPLSFGGHQSIGSIDTVQAQNGAHSDLAFGGSAGMTYLENTTVNGKPVFNGSRTVYFSFGLEALGTETYAATVNKLKLFATNNLRSHVLHNVVDYLRTGSYTGFIRQGTTGGAGVPGATVYLIPNGNGAIPGNTRNQPTYSALTDSTGRYDIHGVEPGAYQVVAYKTGFSRAVEGSGLTVSTTDADTTQTVNLNIAPLPPGSINGRVIDQSTNPVAGATVTYTSSDGSQTYTAISGVDGTYKISSVGAGTYAGIASKKPQYSDSPANSVTVTGGTPSTAPDLVVTLLGASITGRAYNVITGNDLPGVTVTLTDAIGKVVATTTTGAQTDTSPNYTFTNVTVPLAGATFTITASLVNFTSSPISVTLTPAQASTGQDIALTPIPPPQPGALGGLITDGFTGQPLAGVTVTITGNGLASPIIVTTGAVSSPAAPNGDSQPLNYTVGNLAPGTYTISAAKAGFSQPALASATVRSVAFTRADFTGQNNFAPVHVFPAGLLFFSVPYDFGAAGQTFDSIFGKLKVDRSNVAVWQPQLLQYVLDPTPPADGFHLGQGYWIRVLNHPAEVAVDVTGLTPGAPTIAVGLHKGWNMIGVPNRTSVPVSSLSFANPTGGGAISFANAVSPAYLLVSGTLYSYTGSTTNPYASLTAGGSLQTWQAYWIYAYVDTTVLIPAG